MYESKISTARWIVYDIFGNIGWITYCICAGKLLRRGISPASVLALLPAVLMLVGIVELISERIAKLDYVLPKARLYRGFGALILGGITGTVAAVVILLCLERTALPVWMLGGGALCAVFAGLLFREYHPVG